MCWVLQLQSDIKHHPQPSRVLQGCGESGKSRMEDETTGCVWLHQGEAFSTAGAQRRAWLWRIKSHWARRTEGGVCMCENTEGSKGPLLLIYDFSHNYKCYITSLCWTFAVWPPDLSSSFCTLLSAHEVGPQIELSLGLLELWLLVRFGQYKAPARDQRMVEIDVRVLLPNSLTDGSHGPQWLSPGLSMPLSLQFCSTSLLLPLQMWGRRAPTLPTLGNCTPTCFCYWVLPVPL